MAPPRRATVTVTTSPLLVAPPSTSRERLILNNVGTVVIYLSSYSETGTADSFPLGPGDKMETSDVDAFYAFTAAGSSNLGVWDDCQP